MTREENIKCKIEFLKKQQREANSFRTIFRLVDEISKLTNYLNGYGY